MSEFLSERFAYLRPYVPGEQPKGKSYIKLNTNESPFPPSPKVIAALNAKEAEKLNLYSDPTAESLIAALAERFDKKKTEVFAGNGSDEVLAFIFNAFSDKKKGMAFPEIGYGFYPVFCDMLGIPYRAVPLNADFTIDISRFRGLEENIVIANPNAQTGLYLPVSDIETIVSENYKRLVIVDEAYCDFGGESAMSLMRKYENIIVVSTMSKSRQLAGARIGYAVASEAIVEDLNKMKYSFNPYNLNSLSIIAGTEALKDEDYFDLCRRTVIENREECKRVLRGMGFSVTDSLANFVFASYPGIDGKSLYSALKERGVLVRFLSDGKLNCGVRITIGSVSQMEALYLMIDEILKERNLR